MQAEKESQTCKKCENRKKQLLKYLVNTSPREEEMLSDFSQWRMLGSHAINYLQKGLAMSHLSFQLRNKGKQSEGIKHKS